MNNLLQYDTMKIVGAKLSAIKIPLILSGLGVGIISSLISLLFINIMLGLLTAFVIKVKFSHLIFILGFIQLGFGILLGLGGSLIATTKIKFRN
jgi:cell division protein FtsX